MYIPKANGGSVQPMLITALVLFWPVTHKGLGRVLNGVRTSSLLILAKYIYTLGHFL